MQFVDVKIHGAVATLLMERPESRNALNPKLVEDLSTAFSDVHQEKRVKAVVLAGHGQHFCSGIDLQILSQIASMPQMDALAEWAAVWRGLTELFEQLLKFPKPVIAAVDGAAFGSGLGLAAACDMIVPSTAAQFGSIAIRRGLVDGATTALLAFRFGGATAARLTLSGQIIDAAEAYRRGMCEPPVPPEQVWVAASELANACSEAPREAVQANKRVLNESIGETLLTQLAAGAADSATSCTTDAAVEGIEAFLQNREPQWP